MFIDFLQLMIGHKMRCFSCNNEVMQSIFILDLYSERASGELVCDVISSGLWGL